MMRTITAGLVTLGLVALVGCNTSPPGGSGGSRGTGASGATSSNAMFKIKPPTLSTTLKQGESKEVEITLDRGSAFHDDVTLDFKDSNGQGLKIEPSEKVVKASDPEKVMVKFVSDASTSVGDHKIVVTGKPGSGSTVAADFTVKVEKP